MKYIKTAIPEVVILEPTLYGDHRGFFMETWQHRAFVEHVADVNFVQDNHSKSAQGILRGLHYQVKHSQGKLVRVTQGAVFDVAVDMRRSSPTFGRWVGCELSSKNRRMLWVPAGFAHGFYVLSDTAEFVYKCTDYYAPDYERSLAWDDEFIGIDWPLVGGNAPLLSDKDRQGVSFKSAEYFS